jgi:hypothetical protein
MATLLDICNKPLSEMSMEELQQHLLDIRRNRRTPPPPPKSPKKEAKPKSISAGEITPEDAADLLKLLGVTDD